jgi:putative ABC transport system ATP-binding protein
MKRDEAMNEPLIRLTGVSKDYQRGSQKVSVLDGVDLEIGRGAFEAIMGPSGSGKTTLLNLIGGIDRATAGRVEVAGEDITNRSEDDLADWRLRHVGFVFQFYNLVQVLTAFQNVELPLLLARLPTAERRRRVQVALELVGLAERGDHYPHQLSGGQEQRVGIARAIVTDPTIIVADEPTGDLDRASADQVLHLLRRLNDEMGTTILMVTHDPRAAESARLIRCIDKGKLIEARPVVRGPGLSSSEPVYSSAASQATDADAAGPLI